MTQPNDLPTTELMQAGETFARLGLDCPWVGENAWCDLSGRGIVAASRETQYLPTHFVSCPPTVAAAVVAFAIRVRRWDLVRQMRNHAEAVKGMDYHDRIDRKPWPRQFPETVEEAAALIVAVAQAVEGE